MRPWLARSSRMVWLRKAFATLAFMMGAIACGADAGPPPADSFVDRFDALKPALQCLDTAPRERQALEGCISAARLTEADLKGDRDRPAEPPQVLAAWLMIDRDPSKQLTEEMFAASTAYARCIERQSLAASLPKGASEQAYYSAARAIEAACESLLPDVTPVLRGEEVAADVYMQWSLSRAMGGITHLYLARTGGWYPDALVTCHRYGDGRPPSPACAGRPERPVVAPPPPRG